jgi:hypothetical protein
MENNVAHFRLMEDITLMQDSLGAEQMLNGTYICPPSTDDFTWDFLACMQHPLFSKCRCNIYVIAIAAKKGD